MKYKAAIFDMDGTILNTSEDIYDCVNLYLKKFGYPPCSIDDVELAMGGGSKKMIKMLLPQDVSDEAYNRFLSEYIPYYETKGKDKTAPFAGIPEMLKELKSLGIKTAVVSNKPHPAVLALCDHYYKELFDVAIGDDFIMKGKPAPDCIFKAIDILGVDKDEAVYIGDSEYDIEAMKNADMDGILITWGYRKKEDMLKLNPPMVADTVDELKGLITK